MISTFTARRSGLRSCATCIAILWFADCARDRKIGRGRAYGITRRARLEPWRSNRRGRLQGVERNCRLGGRCGRRTVESDTLPGLGIETSGTRNCGEFVITRHGPPASIDLAQIVLVVRIGVAQLLVTTPYRWIAFLVILGRHLE
jgi:hypothetical protein